MNKSLPYRFAGLKRQLGLLIASVSLSHAALAAEECPALLVLKVENIAMEDVATAQKYADCVSVPWLPIEAERSEKLKGCSTVRPTSVGVKLHQALDWVNHIASQLPGCETRLMIARK